MVFEEKLFKAKNWQRTDDGQRLITIAHNEHFVLRWAKKNWGEGGGGGGESAGVSEFFTMNPESKFKKFFFAWGKGGGGMKGGG